MQVLRDLFRYKPSITKEQFFSAGNFAERKVMMCTDILRLVRDRVRLLEPQKPTNPNIKVSSVIDNRRNSKVCCFCFFLSLPFLGILSVVLISWLLLCLLNLWIFNILEKPRLFPILTSWTLLQNFGLFIFVWNGNVHVQLHS